MPKKTMMDGGKTQKQWSEQAHRALLVAVALLAVLLVQIPKLAGELRVDEDFRSFYWMGRYRDPELFPEDPFGTINYVDVQLPWGTWTYSPASPGYAFLFRLASLVIEPIHFSKLIGFLLAPLAVWYLSKLGEQVGGRRTGSLLALGFLALNLVSPTSISVLPGLQRSFACPLIIALLYYLHRRRYGAAAVVLALSASIYAPVFSLAAATWALYAFRPAWPLGAVGRFALRKGLRSLLIGSLVGVVLLAPTLYVRYTDSSTREARGYSLARTTATTGETYEHLWDNPQFGPNGARRLFDWFPLIGRAGIVNKALDALLLAILLAVACLIYAVLGRRLPELPRVLWSLLGASVLMYALAWVAMALTDSFLLYLPSRYTRVGLFLTLLSYVFLNAEAGVAGAILWIRRRREQLPWAVGLVELVAVGLVLLMPSERSVFMGVDFRWVLGLASLVFGLVAVLYFKRRPQTGAAVRPQAEAFLKRIWVRRLVGAALLGALVAVWLPYAWKVNEFLDPSESEMNLYRFLRTLPKDALLAGTPCALDSVPLLAKRQILFSCEQVENDSATVRQALLAYYANDIGEVAALCRQYGIDYLVVHEGAYAPDYLGGQMFFDPWNEELVSAVAGKESFALVEVPEEDRLFQAEDLFVVACDALGESH